MRGSIVANGVVGGVASTSESGRPPLSSLLFPRIPKFSINDQQRRVVNVAVYIVKRHLKKKRRNGQRQHKFVLRWKNPATGKWQCENTGTADMTEARELQKAKWAELNGPWQEINQADPDSTPRPSWQEGRDALSRAMAPTICGASSMSDSLLLFDAVRRMFPECMSPSDLTPKLANEYKRRVLKGMQNTESSRFLPGLCEAT